jgi:hypothetical protein
MQIRRSVRRHLAVAGVAMALLLAGRANAQVLDQVPSDALAVLKIKDLDAVSKKAARMAKDLGLDQVSPEFGDPLGALEDAAHLGKGVDKKGDLAVVMEDPDKFGGNSEKSVLILVPIDDYKAFLGNFKATESVGEVTKATPVDGDEDVYVAHWGSFAAISPSKEIVAGKPRGLKLEGVIAKEAESKDAIIYANVVALRAKALPELKKAREQMVSQFEKQVSDTGGDAFKQFTPVIHVVLNEYMDAIEQVLNDARGAVLGVNLGAEGISTTMLSDFEPDSAIGKLAGEVKNTDKPLLAGLPDRKYFAVGGSVNNPELSAKLLDDVLGPIKVELAKIDQAKKFIPAIESFQKSASSTTGAAAGWVAPVGALGAESVLQQVAVLHGDAKAIHESQRELIGAMDDLFKSMPQQKDAPSFKFELKPDARTVDGVKLDTYETKTEISEDNPTGAQVKQIMAMVYGPNGQTGVLGEVNAKTLVSIQGGSDELISQAVAAAKDNTDTVSQQAGLKAVAGELPKNRAYVAYLDLGTIVGTVIRDAKGMGLPVNVKLQPNLPPIGMAAGSEGSAFRVDVFIPNTLVQGMVAAYMQAQQQMKNGPGGGL